MQDGPDQSDDARSSGSPSDASGDGPAAEEIRTQLQRIIANPAFDASQRRRRFLTYIVEEAIAGRTDRLKGYVIATTVFGRGEGFDPQTDPVVRLEAGRLRRALEHYYLTEGHEDPVRIEVPKGGYVPSFHRHAHAVTGPGALPVPALVPSARSSFARYLQRQPPMVGALLFGAVILTTIALGWLGVSWFGWPPRLGPSESHAEGPRHSRPSVVVAPFEDLSPRPDHFIVNGLAQEVLSGLIRFESLVVFDGLASFRASEESPLELAERLGADYLVVGRTQQSNGQIRVDAELIKLATGATIWAASYDAEPTVNRLFAIQGEIAASVAAAIAQPYGVVHRDVRRQLGRAAPGDLGTYECLVQAYDYRRDMHPAAHARVRTCLEKAVIREPGHADALAMLSMIYLDEFRWRFNPRPGRDPLDDALEMAERARENGPKSQAAWAALFEAHFFRSDLDRAFAAGERAIALNPSNPEIMALVGLRKALAGQWDRGLALLEQALAMNPAPPPWYYFAMSADAFRKGHDDEALRWAEKIELDGLFWTHVVRAATYGQLGRKDDAARAVAHLLEVYPDFEERALTELGRQHLEPAVLARYLDGLRKAGLDIPGQTADDAPEPTTGSSG